MISREEFKNLVVAGANIIRTIRQKEEAAKLFDSENEHASFVLTEVFEDAHFEEFMECIRSLMATYDLHDAFDALVETAVNLEADCDERLIQTMYFDAVSAFAFDENKGEQYADLLIDYLITGQGEEAISALEQEMSPEDIYWVRHNF
jgi:hypothetical protein